MIEKQRSVKTRKTPNNNTVMLILVLLLVTIIVGVAVYFGLRSLNTSFKTPSPEPSSAAAPLSEKPVPLSAKDADSQPPLTFTVDTTVLPKTASGK